MQNIKIIFFYLRINRYLTIHDGLSSKQHTELKNNNALRH